MEILDAILHIGVETNPLLDEKKFLRKFGHPFYIGRVIFRTVAGTLPAQIAIVAADLVSNFAAEQFVNRYIRSLSGYVP